jgi:hypothetical protein
MPLGDMAIQAPGHQLAERIVSGDRIGQEAGDILRSGDGGDDQVAPGCDDKVRGEESACACFVERNDQ